MKTFSKDAFEFRELKIVCGNNEERIRKPPLSVHFNLGRPRYYMVSITMYYPGFPNLKNILREGFHISPQTLLPTNPKENPTVNFCRQHNLCQNLTNIASALLPSPPRKDPSFATIPTAKHAPSTFSPNNSLALTSSCPILSPPLLTVNPQALCTNFRL